ncbi:MAG TPA: GNAT family N-acyltransferase [Candidatus Binatia bacterium]|nr:GNAT family N-acyltransferase [Candidatus Binatia bacterium]
MQQSPEGFRLETLLAEMRIRTDIETADRARIPVRGPVVVVANQPHGIVDGAILSTVLTRVRPDVKVLTHFLFSNIPELQRLCIFVDSFQTDRSLEANRKALREAVAWLQEGGMLAMFPAGEALHWQMPVAQIADPGWDTTAVRLIRRTGALALPVHFCGRNNFGAQILGAIHPKLRSAFLLQEFLRQAGKAVEVRVGSALPQDSIVNIDDDREATEYLRWRTNLLARRSRETNSKTPARFIFPTKMQEPVAAPISAGILAREIENLPAMNRLADSGELSVYVATAVEIPNAWLEVGRLRELTFRQAGEGTGRSRDLDSFDQYYWHILLWNSAQRELVGAYRAGSTAQILKARGVSGLYTSTLFRFDERFFEKLGPALELGRSFVRPEYQRQYAPLLLLWKGIARLAALHPEAAVLFGAVSISNDYNAASREMIYRFFEARMQRDDLSAMVEPRCPFRTSLLRRWDCRSMCRALHDIDELSQPITDVEADGKGLPVLLRQYAKIGGKLVGFNVDRKFSNVLDGLVVVDLRQTDPGVLDRYMGREAAAKFRRIHGPS